ncbi:hypothetical protein O9993_06455 [Vibrio lentus]|nr:hypothetical protein [Vibrio lentus]
MIRCHFGIKANGTLGRLPFLRLPCHSGGYSMLTAVDGVGGLRTATTHQAGNTNGLLNGVSYGYLRFIRECRCFFLVRSFVIKNLDAVMKLQ